MDENDADRNDYFLLIDLYLEGWLDDTAMAMVERKVAASPNAQQQAVVMLALRQEDEQLKREAASREAIQGMLQAIAPGRRPVTRLRKLRQTVPTWVPFVVLLLGGTLGLLFYLNPDDLPDPVATDSSPVTIPDSSLLSEDADNVVEDSEDSARKPPPRPKEQRPQLVYTRPLTVYAPEKTDDSFGMGTAYVPVDTLEVRLYRVGGPAEYTFESRMLRLYLPLWLLKPAPALRLRRRADGTFVLRVNKIDYRLRRGRRYPLR